jgi:hypothetical protein
MKEYKQSEMESEPYGKYWATLSYLCEVEIEKKTLGFEKLFPHDELNYEAETLINEMSPSLLKETCAEV